MNTYDLPSRTFSKLASTTYHEAIPGHHFQISLEMEQAGLNVFRRLGARAAAGAYLEGWGLYAERLADELGLYRSTAERFGMLDAQAWRASRLIVDSGMHALGWSRQQSIDWLLDTGLSETDAVIETDRYIVWPGQALTYMTGMREIRRLRHELEARDGARVRPPPLPRRADRPRLPPPRDAVQGAAPLGDARLRLPRVVRPAPPRRCLSGNESGPNGSAMPSSARSVRARHQFASWQALEPRSSRKPASCHASAIARGRRSTCTDAYQVAAQATPSERDLESREVVESARARAAGSGGRAARS